MICRVLVGPSCPSVRRVRMVHQLVTGTLTVGGAAGAQGVP